MVNHFLGVVGVEGRGLEEDSALDVVDVFLAEKDALENMSAYLSRETIPFCDI